MPPPNTPVDPAATPVSDPDGDPPASTGPLNNLDSIFHPGARTSPHADLINEESRAKHRATPEDNQLAPFLPSLSPAYTGIPIPREKTRLVDSDGNPFHNLELIHDLDFSALTYIGTVDENLICSICRTPFFEPVITDCCHIFCRLCLQRSLKHSPLCPIDRSPLGIDEDDFVKAPTIINNQVDALKVECPACSSPLVRSTIGTHLTKYCPEARMLCPGHYTDKGCPFFILRKHLSKDCLHYQEHCPDCDMMVMVIDMDHHREKECSERIRTCEHCGAEYPFMKSSSHLSICPDVDTSCKWSEYGCSYTTKRKTLVSHEKFCDFRFIGQKLEGMTKEISELKSELSGLSKERSEQDRRMKVLETTIKNFRIPFEDDSDSTHDPLAGLRDSADPVFTTGFDHVMTLMERQQTNIDKVSTTMRELEARYATLLFNETIQLRNDLAELRSLQQTTSMHVRWLLRLRIQENKRVGGTSGVGHSAGGSGGSETDSGPSMGPRRSSDSLHQPPRL
ncbi:hypothetical protein EG329_010364 [Mollisiaceae sp. DMI_Dod_QoI]|nr:hypothetical protein EG329_010364 [Helotiales sp. DMI_Dod_QoI]